LYLDETLEASTVFLLEFNFDVSQVTFGPGDDQPDEMFVLDDDTCACRALFHAFVQLLGEVSRAVRNAPN